MNLARILDEEVLPFVEKPSRYLGTEVNSIHKDAARVDLRLALCFPDLYDIGLGNLGLHILYAILNRIDGVWAERVYAPGLDLEAVLRKRSLPLFGWESKDSLDHFDGIGFTLQSELTFTNILNVLDLAGLPLRTRDRRPNDPLTFAGGPAVFNPEPLAPFMDFFVIGDGEDVVVEIAEVLRRNRGRSERLEALARVEGVYVPALYPMDTLPDGSIRPALGAPPIRKRTVASLEAATYPVDLIVPFTEQVHDRASLEVLRGCTQGCRFCQAGMTTRPVRERSIDHLETLLERQLDATGYEDVSLVSLSTCDYSRPRQLVDRMVRVARDRGAAVGLPSLRLDSFSVDLSDMVADTRRTGLTFAPEAATPRLRALINKWIPDEDLLQMAGAAYERGWDHVKLYFMIGLPTERDEDVVAIAELCGRTVREGRRHRPDASVRTGVSTFVPKPFTPFQWAAQIGTAETEQKQELLKQSLKSTRGVKFGRHHPEETFLEGLVSRADRRAGDLIEAAWRQGARFDAWSEHLDFAAWMRAVDEVGYDVADALRERSVDERLPWDHIDVHIPKDWLARDWAEALELRHAPDCRQKKCHRCGVIDVLRPLCASMLRESRDGAKEERAWVRPPLPEPTGSAQAQRVRFRVGRVGPARLLGHLEFMTAWHRALRRARLPVSLSQGFHPQPRVNFSAALPTGEESTGEYMDVILSDRVDVQEADRRLRATAPSGFLVLGAVEVPLRVDGLMGQVDGALYTLHVDQDVSDRVWSLVSATSLPMTRKSKAGPITVDVRPMIRALSVGEGGAVDLEVVSVDGRPGKARDVVALLGLDADRVRVVKRDVRVGGVSPGAGWSRETAEGGAVG